MRDPNRLQVFQLADALVLDVHAFTRAFPPDERFGLTAQLRRAVVSIASNLVEGCSRDSPREFAQFVRQALGSALEVQYQLSLATRLGYGPKEIATPTAARASSLAKRLNVLARTIPLSKRT